MPQKSIQELEVLAASPLFQQLVEGNQHLGLSLAIVGGSLVMTLSLILFIVVCTMKPTNENKGGVIAVLTVLILSSIVASMIGIAHYNKAHERAIQTLTNIENGK